MAGARTGTVKLPETFSPRVSQTEGVFFSLQILSWFSHNFLHLFKFNVSGVILVLK